MPEQPGLFGWSPDHAEILRGLMRPRDFPAGTIVYAEGDRGDDFFVLQSGRAKLVLTSRDGREVALRLRGALGAFGAFSAIDGGPREATLQTLTSCRFGVITGADLRRFMDQAPLFRAVLLEKLVLEIRYLYQRLADLSQYTVRERLALEILRQVENWQRQGRSLADFRLPPQMVLAGLIDTTREAVSRELRPLFATATLRRVGRQATIADLAGLRGLLAVQEGRGIVQYYPDSSG